MQTARCRRPLWLRLLAFTVTLAFGTQALLAVPLQARAETQHRYTLTYGTNDRLLSAGDKSYGYDAADQITSETRTGANAYTHSKT